ncbi:hypothetical protein BDK51DRAFT_43193 [Blyttiomyces helicus]|uniref:Uncharacterized protein n=1 Tax=Blyttiomyces helicus TaxID=388810 RepID=A0A4P9VXJ2_9FUNG|nr:hypothetical protein BDK51DRAFT_43193 [Blyttiomyces helicus]|eukprot:RKO83433.1 hypothetical protein BDK51DRAFT_43193 [Blyttiomyces helicus]
MIVKQAFGRLKNRFRILLTKQAAPPAEARERGQSLYLQVWDWRSAKEEKFDELPNVTARDQQDGDVRWQLLQEKAEMEDMRDSLARALGC